MAFGLQNFVKDIEAREDGKPVGKDISVKKDAPAAAPAAKRPSGPMDKVQAVIPELYKIEKDPKHAMALSGETLKTLCELGVIDITINEKGSKLTESFRMIETVTGKLQKEPAEDMPETKTLAERVSAMPQKGDDNDDDIICTKRPAERKPQTSIYLIETPRDKKPAEAAKAATALIPPLADAPKTEAPAPGAPLIPPKPQDQQR